MMAQLQNIIDDFNEAIADVADVWQEQRGNFTDSKIEQFGTNIFIQYFLSEQRLLELWFLWASAKNLLTKKKYSV